MGFVHTGPGEFTDELGFRLIKKQHKRSRYVWSVFAPNGAELGATRTLDEANQFAVQHAKATRLRRGKGHDQDEEHSLGRAGHRR